jgi:bacterioferritin
MTLCPARTVAPACSAVLEAALAAEVETIDRYVKRRVQAEAAAEHGLAAEFDNIITDESNHRDELRLMLARWP